MTDKAKLITRGGTQSVQLPQECRFEGSEVYIRRDLVTRDVVLSSRPNTWDGLFALDATTEVPADFMSEADRAQGGQGKDPFARK